jgi:hypothetical protein
LTWDLVPCISWTSSADSIATKILGLPQRHDQTALQTDPGTGRQWVGRKWHVVFVCATI